MRRRAAYLFHHWRVVLLQTAAASAFVPAADPQYWGKHYWGSHYFGQAYWG